jgi:hypothetical protein
VSHGCSYSWVDCSRRLRIYQKSRFVNPRLVKNGFLLRF